MRRLAVVLALLVTVPAVAAFDFTDPRNYTWEVEGVLAVGGGGLDEEEVAWLHGEGFRAIANFRAEHRDPEAKMAELGIRHLYLPVDHTAHINVSQVRQFVAWAKQQEAAGRPIYAHCTAGLHRSAVFATGWEMERTGESYDVVRNRVEDRREATQSRNPSALLEYEASLRGQEALTVILKAPKTRPSYDGTMPVTVEVLAQGRPLADAAVRIWTESKRIDFTGRTGSDGKFSFTYKAPSCCSVLDYLFARATKSGYASGADQAQLFFKQSAQSGQLSVSTKIVSGGVGVKVMKPDGSTSRARVLALASDGTYDTEVTNTGYAVLDVTTSGTVAVRAELWGYTAATKVLTAADPDPSPDPDPAPQPVTFDHRGGNEWWVQVRLGGDGAPRVRAVEAMDDGGAWKPLTLRSWGDWAGSFHVEPGHRVRFRATLDDGTVVASCWFTHPGGVAECGTEPPPPPPPSGFDATFSNVRGNTGWVETDVKATGGTLASVDMRLNGGEWKPLTKRSWGSWARATSAPVGSTVEFRATATDGATDLSALYVWPP